MVPPLPPVWRHYISNAFLLVYKWSIVQGREIHPVANGREGALYPSSAPVVKGVPEWLCLWWAAIVIIYLTSSLLLMLSVAMVMGYNCRAMTSHAECGSVREAQCSSHKIMVHRRRVTAEILRTLQWHTAAAAVTVCVLHPKCIWTE